MAERSQYHRFGLVAQGQFGKVYCAFHRTTGDWVALKILDARRSPTAEFLRELSTILALRHPNLVQLYGVEHQPQQRCLILDYCEGGTLRQLLNASYQPTLNVLLQLLIELLRGLDHAHQQGIVHCDVKPENVLLKLTPQGWQPKLTDFGVAQNQALPPIEPQGSPAYMAPEQFYGQVSPSVDVYAVGIILHECLLGSRPFSGTPTQLRKAHLNQRLLLPQRLPVRFQRILQRALEKLPARRFPNAAAMADALAELCPTRQPGFYRHLFEPQFPQPEPWPLPPHSSRVTDISSESLSEPLSEPFPSWLPASNSLKVDWVGLAPDHSWGAWVGSKGLSLQLICCFAPATRRSSQTRALTLPPGTNLEGLILLDHRHGVLICQSTVCPEKLDQEAPDPTTGVTASNKASTRDSATTQLILFNRRGATLSPLKLPLALDFCIGGTQPLQLLALERMQPQVLLKISLRPLQLERVPLPLQVIAIAPFSWGIALADQAGQLLLVDHAGEVLGYWQAPVEGKLISLKSKGDQRLMLALACVSGDGDEFMNTYVLNLPALDLALVF